MIDEGVAMERLVEFVVVRQRELSGRPSLPGDGELGDEVAARHARGVSALAACSMQTDLSVLARN